MSKKRSEGIVYSTNPNFEYHDTGETVETLHPQQQQLRVMLDKKQRGGKKVTLVTGFVGNDVDLQVLGKMLKTACGVGGTVKDGEVMIQGDFRDRVMSILLDEGYKAKQSGG